MRAYVNATLGLNVRLAPKTSGQFVRLATYGSVLEVDQIKRGVWSKLLNTTPQQYAYGDYLQDTPPENVMVNSVSYSRINLHISAGGWPPKEPEKRTLQANKVQSVLIPAYEPNLADLMIRECRNAGVEQFVIRAVAPVFPKDGAEWARMAVPRVRAFSNALGTTAIMMQLHNEPNLTDEGYKTGWQDGAEYNRWYMRALRVFRVEFPGIKIGFSPMSPGFAIENRRAQEDSFYSKCKESIENSDWFAVHCYYGNPDAKDLVIPDAMWRRYAVKTQTGRRVSIPIMCTEAGPSQWKQITNEGAARMFKMFADVRIPAFGWLLYSTGDKSFMGQSWAENNIVVPKYA